MTSLSIHGVVEVTVKERDCVADAYKEYPPLPYRVRSYTFIDEAGNEYEVIAFMSDKAPRLTSVKPEEEAMPKIKPRPQHSLEKGLMSVMKAQANVYATMNGIEKPFREI